MNTRVRKFILISMLSYLVICATGCSEVGKTLENKSQKEEKTEEVHTKPPSNYADTLLIRGLCAVFYEPDSLQLLEIKKVTSPQIYDGSMHEYFYKIKTAHLDLERNWKQIKIIDAKRVRFLQFQKSDGTSTIIDLNNFGDAYGMFIFDGKKDPSLVDMANLASDLNYYLSR